MFGLQLKNDDGFYIIALIVIAIQFVFIWMRIQLKKMGREYSPINTSFRVYSDFMTQISKSKLLKTKYKITLISIILVIVILIIVIVSD